MRKRIGVPIMAALLGLAAVDTSQALTFTCETVVLDREQDPAGAVFGKRYESPRINANGDVVFIAHPKGGPRRVYVYPAGGAASVLASAGDAAPAGSTFKRFRAPSINDAGDIAFIGDLQGGEGVYARLGGSLVKVVRDGEAAPLGGLFDQFLNAARINDDGDVAFVALLDDGATGAFFYDRSSGTVVELARTGTATGDGREFCDFSEIGLGESAAAFEVVVKPVCANPGDPEVSGIWETFGIGFITVAEVGDTAPNGFLYDSFLGAPDLNAAGKVLFRVSTTANVEIVLFDPAGPTSTELVAAGDPTPDLNPVTDDGTLRNVSFGSVTNDDRTAVGVRIQGGQGTVPRTAIFMFDGAPDTVVLATDPPPAPFPQFSSYNKIGVGVQRTFEEIGNDRSGTQVVYGATVRSAEQPRGRAGLFRCAGS